MRSCFSGKCAFIFLALSYLKQITPLSGTVSQTGDGFFKVFQNSTILKEERVKNFKSKKHRAHMVSKRATVAGKARENDLERQSRPQKRHIGRNLKYRYRKRYRNNHEEKVNPYSTRISHNTQRLRHNFQKTFISKKLKNNRKTKIKNLFKERSSRKKISMSFPRGKKQEKLFRKVLDHSKSIGAYMGYKNRLKSHHLLTHSIVHSAQRFRLLKLKGGTNHEHSRQNGPNRLDHKGIHSEFARRGPKENNKHHFLPVGRKKRKNHFERGFTTPLKHRAKMRFANHKTIINRKKIFRKSRKKVDLKISKPNKINKRRKHIKQRCHQNCPGRNSKANKRQKKWSFIQGDHVVSRSKKGKRYPFWHKWLRFTLSRKYSKKRHLRCRLPGDLCKNLRNRHGDINTRNKIYNKKNEHVKKTSRKKDISTQKDEHGLFKTMVRDIAKNQHRNSDKKPSKHRIKSKNLLKNENKGTKSFHHRNHGRFQHSEKVDDNHGHVYCEHSKKIIRKMIYQMNKALRRSMILAKIIGKKFGIDDKTIEALLIKEEDKISRNFINVKKKH
ncbi:uncharacterized protein LOC114535313 [Dendronephthya gigantea]|uniref:uncharacterized protein LOC114535313 n=1 Tax=Dendronephthya gigantea TaxID=151771 RepID=UPI00106A071E|nr:uncharacterized protein LOC114535313 [Dendronephthya gigantea]